MDQHRWQLRGTTASVRFARGEARLDLLRPQTGINLDGEEFAASRFMSLATGVGNAALPASEVESYVRGDDLVATYATTAARPTRVQLYWRLFPIGAERQNSACELIISAQTPLWDCDPTIRMQTDLSHVRAARQQAGITVCELAGATYLEAVHPHDFQETNLAWSRPPATELPEEERGAVAIRQTLFAQRLEKGVILRARLLAAWLPRNVEESQIADLYARFAASPPVLTT